PSRPTKNGNPEAPAARAQLIITPRPLGATTRSGYKHPTAYAAQTRHQPFRSAATTIPRKANDGRGLSAKHGAWDVERTSHRQGGVLPAVEGSITSQPHDGANRSENSIGSDTSSQISLEPRRRM